MRFVVENLAIKEGFLRLLLFLPAVIILLLLLYTCTSEDWPLVQQRLQRSSLAAPEENK